MILKVFIRLFLTTKLSSNEDIKIDNLIFTNTLGQAISTSFFLKKKFKTQSNSNP